MVNEEVKALIALIDDPSPDVFAAVSQRLYELGSAAIPSLEEYWTHSTSEQQQKLIEDVLQRINSKLLGDQVQKWLDEGCENIVDGAHIVAQLIFPELKLQDLKDQVDKLAKEVWVEINNNLTAFEKVKLINHILYEKHHYSPDPLNLFAPHYFALNHVMLTQKGNPLSLSLLYMAIGQQLGMPIYGISLPRNFILAYKDPYHGDDVDLLISQRVLFYINPFNRGSVLSKKEIDYYLNQIKELPQESYYLPCDNRTSIVKVLENLKLVYEQAKNDAQVKRIEMLIEKLS
jgi:regulator of sirC expression with transglutaminase-like and TPR domain